MSTQLQTAFKNILAMPHFANQHSAGTKRHDSHEEALAEVFTTAGFTEDVHLTIGKNSKGRKIKVLKYTKLKKAALLKAIELDGNDRQTAIAKLVPGMAKGTFIRQPAGSQSFPDFLVCDFSGKFVVIEAKSGSGGGPVWNDSLPRAGSVYVMSSGKYNKSTVWLGEDWLSASEAAIFEKLYADIDAIVSKANVELKNLNSFKRGWQFYSRKKHQQGGKVEFTDPFRHPDRNANEEHVLKFALEQ